MELYRYGRNAKTRGAGVIVHTHPLPAGTHVGEAYRRSILAMHAGRVGARGWIVTGVKAEELEGVERLEFLKLRVTGAARSGSVE